MRADERGRAWIVVVLLFIFMMINAADKAVIGIAAVPMMQGMQRGPRQFGLAGSSFFLLFAISSVATGFLVGALGVVVAVPLINWVIMRWTWHWAFGSLGLIGFVWCALWLAFGREGTLEQGVSNSAHAR